MKLGVHRLPQAEAGLVRALLSLSQGGGASTWTFTASGPCDLLLADAQAPDLGAAVADRGARMLARLGAGRDDAQALAIARPLRAGALEACLRQAQQRMADADPLPPAVAVAPPAPPAPQCTGGEPSSLRRRYMLRRWPPSELLRGEAHRVRMASQLSRRFLSACELAQLTQSEPQRSHLFLQLLQGFSLLEAEPAAAGAVAPRAAARPRPPADGGLVRSIRRRLGL